MPKLMSATCNKKKPAGARCVKTAFPESSRRKGYFVPGGAPVVKLKRGSAKGCVRTARPAESKRIRQAHRVSAAQLRVNRIMRDSIKASAKKVSPKKASVKKAKKASGKKSSTKK